MAVQRIVVGVTESETSQRAAQKAADYAAANGAELHVVTAVRRAQHEVIEAGTDEWEFSTLDQAQHNVSRFVASLAPGVSHTVVALEGDPADVLVGEAKRVGADLIVVGNVRMQGPTRILGSVGAKVLHTAPCDVLIVKTS